MRSARNPAPKKPTHCAHCGTVRLARFSLELERAGYQHSKGYAQIGNGLFPPPIKLGAKSVIPTYETDAIIAAHIRGATDDEVRALVAELMAKRKSAGA